MELKFLAKLEKVLNRVGKKHGIPIDEGKFILGHFFNHFNEAMTDVRIPKVKLPIGTFHPSEGRIRGYIKRVKYWYDKGNMSKELYEARVLRIFPLWVRIKKEEIGQRTWLDWNGNKKRKETQKLVDDVNSKQELKKGKKD